MRLFEIGVNFFLFSSFLFRSKTIERAKMALKITSSISAYLLLGLSVSLPLPLSLSPLVLSLSHSHPFSVSFLSVSPFLPPLERQGNETAREQRKVSAEHQLCMEEVKIYCKWDDASKFIFIQITVIIHYSFPCKHLASVFVMRCHYLPDYVIKLLTRQARRATIQGHA